MVCLFCSCPPSPFFSPAFWQSWPGWEVRFVIAKQLQSVVALLARWLRPGPLSSMSACLRVSGHWVFHPSGQSVRTLHIPSWPGQQQLPYHLCSISEHAPNLTARCWIALAFCPADWVGSGCEPLGPLAEGRRFLGPAADPLSPVSSRRPSRQQNNAK